ncbi:beta-1,4-N-acetylgalactosaminyltransferase 3 [Halichoeres trimaculatus]|uniref:beta-1,4-N-acetylgalactosaminyltransferase 3 n=1 Tax=Halichoeres trimaculatus TaxID=147232 RepID=UPI003D9DE5CF
MIRMIAPFFPLKKLRRNGRHLLFGLILLIGVFAVYHEIVAAKAWSSDTGFNPGNNWRRGMFEERARAMHGKVREDHRAVPEEDSTAWRSSFSPQTWKPEYKGQANLHVFEDWCGSSTADLFTNLHYPLYPHSRTTVQKLAVSPQWTDYGLRIFGYIHPYADGDFVFAISSDDNSEFWLSTDDSPLNLQLLTWVGRTGKEWTAPGEFEKYASQTSKPVLLSAQRRYFFEVIHKQDNRGTDHVEVAWLLLNKDISFKVIDSHHISLYVDESAVLMGDVAHIPQTAASHQRTPSKQRSVAADMLREDPRDSLYRVPLMDSKFLQDVLPDCTYRPSYIIKDFPLTRYEGIQFVQLSYVYPNDYTRLTHMETENRCFYPQSPYYMKMFGFSRYMQFDHPIRENPLKDFGFPKRNSVQDKENDIDNEIYYREKEERESKIDNALFPDYGDDYDDYVQNRRRKLFSLVDHEAPASDTEPHGQSLGPMVPKPALPPQVLPTQNIKHNQHPQQNLTKLRHEGQAENLRAKGIFERGKKKTLKSVKKSVLRKQTRTTIPVDRDQLNARKQPGAPSEQLNPKQHQIQRSPKKIKRIKESKVQRRGSVTTNKLKEAGNVTISRDHPRVRLNHSDSDHRNHLRDKKEGMNKPLQKNLESSILKVKTTTRGKKEKKWKGVKEHEDNNIQNREETMNEVRDPLWEQQKYSEGVGDEDLTPAPAFDPEIIWNQTFKFNPLDFQARRSDYIDLSCNVSGNLLIHTSDALPMAEAFVEQLNRKHPGRFTLVRVVNVVKRVDRIKGSRYLLELELKDVNGQLLRLSHYIYVLIQQKSRHRNDFDFHQPKPRLLLCNPVGFHWNPAATVHFIVPVKNQARWVKQLISDMEQLFVETGDSNFNLIITDYDSTDMDVKAALQNSKLRHQYVKLSGNFERSAGLQAGIDLVNDDHSILFLCDLHIYFPPSIIDTIRKHCVEGYMAFAPIVMRLNCGSTPSEARGYWEVNGFGLLGIYKSDLDALGGMNTKEFTNRWGGEDWELLDRILQAGLEVERIYLRNFFHHFHSKRGMWNRKTIPSHREQYYPLPHYEHRGYNNQDYQDT